MPKQLNREQAWALLTEYTATDALRKHALSVEAVMRHYAVLMGEDPEKWGVIGLLHDLDYEQFPHEHCSKSQEILQEQDVDPSYIHAIISHGWGMVNDVEPTLPMEKVLYATDELTGLITAAVLMRPSKSVLDITLSSVKKKFKSPSFAAGVNREVIAKGAEMLDTTVEELITQCILAMQGCAEALGLKGTIE